MRPGQGSGLWYKSRARVQALQFSRAHVPPGARARRVWTPLPGWGPLACGWGLGVGQKGPLNSTHLGALTAEVGTPMSQPSQRETACCPFTVPPGPHKAPAPVGSLSPESKQAVWDAASPLPLALAPRPLAPPAVGGLLNQVWTGPWHLAACRGAREPGS